MLVFGWSGHTAQEGEATQVCTGNTFIDKAKQISGFFSAETCDGLSVFRDPVPRWDSRRCFWRHVHDDAIRRDSPSSAPCLLINLQCQRCYICWHWIGNKKCVYGCASVGFFWIMPTCRFPWGALGAKKVHTIQQMLINGFINVWTHTHVCIWRSRSTDRSTYQNDIYIYI